MIVLIRAFFGSLGWQGWLILVMCILLLASVAAVRHSDRETGALKERTRIEQANDAATGKADAAEQRYRACVASGKSQQECSK